MKKARTEGDDASYYKVVDGVKYDRQLLEMAEGFAKDGQVSYAEAKKLWASAEDGPGITDTEKATFAYALKGLKFSEKASNFMKVSLEAGTHSSYYKTINGVKYDRSLLEMAEGFAKDGQVSYPEAKQLWESAEDGKGVTDIEKSTLEYALKTFKYTDKAKKFMDAVLGHEKHNYYKVIDGQKYDRELLEMAEGFAKDGQIGYPEAKHLWEAAQDGKGVTEIEKNTLSYTMKELKYSEKAANLMKTVLEAGKYASYYLVIDGQKYDRELLEMAKDFAKDGQISDPDAQHLWDAAQDSSKGITEIEKSTLKYTLKELKYTEKAAEFMNAKLGG